MPHPPPTDNKASAEENSQIQKILIIMNDNAGKGQNLDPVSRKLLKLPEKENISPEETQNRIIKAFAQHDLQPKIVLTEYAKHATKLARDAANDSFDVIVAVGGDGTINEVVNGIAGTNTRLGIIPRGTANLLAKEMGIPSKLEKACAVIAKNNAVKIDTATVNDHHFTIMAGIGFDAHVVQKVDDTHVKNKWGALAYPLVAIREIIRYPFNKIQVRTEDGVDHIAFYVFVQNAKVYASGFNMSPKSKKDDGTLEVLMFPTKNILSIVFYVLSWDKLKFQKEIAGVKSLEIKSNHSIQIDGDYICKGPAKIQVRPKSLSILVDEKYSNNHKNKGKKVKNDK